MKFYLLIIAFCSFCALGQDKTPDGYALAPALSITGDFDGDGKQDTLSQFATDSLGNTVKHIIELNEDDHPIILYDRYGYRGAATLNGKGTDLVSGTDIYLCCLINLGNINKAKGDEIAFVPTNLDYSALSHCSIYSYCKGRWVEVFSFGVNENAFDYEGDSKPVFTTIPGALEKHNGKWVYLDYYEMIEQDKPKMKLLKAKSCK